MRRQIVALAFVAAAWTAATAPAAARLRVVERSTVSGPLALTGSCGAQAGANTPLVAAAPSNARMLVAAYLIGATGNGVAAATAYSRDGGRTWRRAPVTGLTGCEGGRAGSLGDPYLTFGPAGHVYLDESGLGEGSDPNADHVYLAASADGGAHFAPAAEPVPGVPTQRGPLATDPLDPASVAIEYETFDAGLGAVGALLPWTIAVAGSADGGRDFAAPHSVASTAPTTVGLAVGLLRSARSLVAVSSETPLTDSAGYLLGVPGGSLTQHVVARRSDDEGASFGAPSPVGRLVTSLGDPAGCCLASTTAGGDGTLYATWTAAAGTKGGSVLLFRSRDRGATWQRLVVATAATRTFESSVAVGAHGRIGVLWLQGAAGASPAGSAADVVARLAVSSDEGRSWRATQLAGPFRPAEAVNLGDGGSLGEYQGITALPDGYGVVLTYVVRATASHGASIVRYLHVRQ